MPPDTAKNEIAVRLRTGELRAALRQGVWLSPDNKEEAKTFWLIKPYIWLNTGNVAESAQTWVTSSRIFVGTGATGINGTASGLRLEASGFEQILIDGGFSVAEHEVVASNKGGRPAKLPWREIWEEVAYQVIDGRISYEKFKTASSLEFHLNDLCNDDLPQEIRFSPGDSTMKPASLKLFKLLKENQGKTTK